MKRLLQSHTLQADHMHTCTLMGLTGTASETYSKFSAASYVGLTLGSAVACTTCQHCFESSHVDAAAVRSKWDKRLLLNPVACKTTTVQTPNQVWAFQVYLLVYHLQGANTNNESSTDFRPHLLVYNVDIFKGQLLHFGLLCSLNSFYSLALPHMTMACVCVPGPRV